MSQQDHGQELDLTPVEGEKPVPVGWKVLLWGLVVFGVYYLWAYSPWSTGWSQSDELDKAGEAAVAGAGVSIFATILFTALAVVAAVTILLALARRKRQP